MSAETSNEAEAEKNPRSDIPEMHQAFLAKVMEQGGLTDPYDARDITEVVFRIMRDLMTTEASDRVAAELHQDALNTDEKALDLEVSDLWKDTNPIVGFLSRLRPPMDDSGPLGIDDERFMTRVKNEAGVPSTVDSTQVVKAIFSATKEELSEARIQEISKCLPGQVAVLWGEA
jgi:uncharacterized protein (DUF2267 family)